MILNKQIAKKISILFIKILFSAISIYFVLNKIDVEQVTSTLQNVNHTLLVISFLFMNFSQFTSALRLKVLLNCININIKFWHNLKLYYKGMFYNLFLPGGIGGDGIKAFILKNRYGQPLKKIASGLILDRLSGLAGLIFLSGFGFLISEHTNPSNWMFSLSILLMLLVYPAFYFLLRFLFRTFVGSFRQISLLGMAVNLVQTLSVIFLFWAIGTTSGLIEYLTVFYIATAAMVFPFTIGGIGIRELIFILAPGYLPIDPEIGLSFCLIFFAMNAISSLAGTFLRTNIREETGP